MSHQAKTRTLCLCISVLCVALPHSAHSQQPNREPIRAPVAGPPPFPQSVAPIAPDWFPLAPNLDKHLNDVLQFWEQEGNKIGRFECNFQRWEYDPTFGPKGENDYRTYSEGEIKYLKPDKGLFKVLTTWVHKAPKEGDPGGKPEYVKKKVEYDDFWICDGKSVFQFDPNKKQVNEVVLPPQMRGQAISDGPLPFLFSANKEKIKDRYWIRTLKSEVKDEYWLEALPQSQADAANYKRILIVIDAKDFLPKAMTIFALTFNPENGNFARTQLVFKDRAVNPKGNLIDKVNPLKQDFFKVQVPEGWEKIVQQLNVNPPEQKQAPAQRPQEAALPKKTPLRSPIKQR